MSIRSLRPWLIMSRASNLPTVWSNCLAGFWLGGGFYSAWLHVASIAAAASLLYTGGTLLNDACDAAFDARYRPERPIPSGTVRRRQVWIASIALLVFGVFAFVTIDVRATDLALLLVGMIVAYNLVHKQTASAALLMGTCRALLYPLAAIAAGMMHPFVIVASVGLGAYVAALSFMARGETAAPSRQKIVGVLLAAIPLVDLLIAGWIYPPCAPVFLALMAAALLLQRVIPAT